MDILDFIRFWNRRYNYYGARIKGKAWIGIERGSGRDSECGEAITYKIEIYAGINKEGERIISKDQSIKRWAKIWYLRCQYRSWQVHWAHSTRFHPWQPCNQSDLTSESNGGPTLNFVITKEATNRWATWKGLWWCWPEEHIWKSSRDYGHQNRSIKRWEQNYGISNRTIWEHEAIRTYIT